MTPRQAREQLEKMREQAAQGKRFKTREEAMEDFYQLIPEMQRTVSHPFNPGRLLLITVSK